MLHFSDWCIKEHAGCQVSELSAANTLRQKKSLLSTVSPYRKLRTLWQRSNNSNTMNSSVKTSSPWKGTMEKSSCTLVSCDHFYKTLTGVNVLYSRLNYILFENYLDYNSSFLHSLYLYWHTSKYYKIHLNFFLYCRGGGNHICTHISIWKRHTRKVCLHKGQSHGGKLLFSQMSFPCMAPVMGHSTVKATATLMDQGQKVHTNVCCCSYKMLWY